MGWSKDVLGIQDSPRRGMEHGHTASGYIGLVFGRRCTGNCWDCHLVKNKDCGIHGICDGKPGHV